MNEYKEKILKICNEHNKATLMETLNIEYIDVGENYLVAKCQLLRRYINLMGFYMVVPLWHWPKV